MANYTVKSRTFKKFEDGRSIFDVTIFVDNAADIPDPEDEWDAGSMCIIGDTHEYRWLNHERMWV